MTQSEIDSLLLDELSAIRQLAHLCSKEENKQDVYSAYLRWSNRLEDKEDK